MKLAKQKTKKPLLLMISGILVLAIAGAGVYWWLNTPTQKSEQPTTENEINYNPPTEQDKNEVDQHKEEIPDENSDKPNTKPDQTSTSTNIGVVITRASQTKGQPLSIRTIIDGATSGECQITLTKAGQATIKKTFTIKFEATSASCNGDIAVSNFKAGGQWTLAIIAKKGQSASQPITQKVTITK